MNGLRLPFSVSRAAPLAVVKLSMSESVSRPRLTKRSLFVIAAMNLIDCINANILAPYAVEMVSSFLNRGPETVQVHTTVARWKRREYLDRYCCITYISLDIREYNIVLYNNITINITIIYIYLTELRSYVLDLKRPRELRSTKRGHAAHRHLLPL